MMLDFKGIMKIIIKHIGLCEKIMGFVLCNSSISSMSIFLYKSEKT